METGVNDILKAAYRLPERKRIELIENLISSLEPESDEEVDALWAEEVERRSRELEQGKVKGIPYAEVREEESDDEAGYSGDLV